MGEEPPLRADSLPGAEGRPGAVGEVEVEHHLQVGELFWAAGRFTVEPVPVDPDDRLRAAQ